MNYNIIQFNITYKQLQRRVAEKCHSLKDKIEHQTQIYG